MNVDRELLELAARTISNERERLMPTREGREREQPPEGKDHWDMMTSASKDRWLRGVEKMFREIFPHMPKVVTLAELQQEHSL